MVLRLGPPLVTPASCLKSGMLCQLDGYQLPLQLI